MARTCCKYFTVSLVPVAALILALLFAFGIISLPIIYTELEKRYEYGMVIDAGSSHTTIYTYKVGVDVSSNNMTGEVEEIDSFNISKSLDSLANNPEEAGHVVTHLISHSNDSLNSIKVPKTLHNITRIYLGATAGMRLLRRSNSSASENVLTSVKKAMEESGFKAKSAIIISGKEEAASGWLTANVLLKKSQDELIGSLDMGGGSTEIAFTSNASGPFHVVEKMRNQPEPLYARSYLCYGHNEARGRFLAHLIHNQSNNSNTVNVSNPCLRVNTTVSYPTSKIYTYCVNGSTANEIFGFSYSPSSNNSKVSFRGTGNQDECIRIIEKLFNFSTCNPEPNCDNGTFVVPPVNGTLVGFSGFNYIAENLTIAKQTFDSKNPVMKVIKANCTSILNGSSGNHTDCFLGLFMGHMLEEGFGMNTGSEKWTLIFKSKEKKISFGWALGYFINKIYKYPEPTTPNHETWPFSAVDMVVGMLILTILCAIFVIFFFLTFYACKKALKGHNGYQSIS